MPTPQRQALRIGRLRQLERMGLAKEPREGVWHIDNELQAKLRGLGERGDIMVIMHKVMRVTGFERPAGDFAMFQGGKGTSLVIGRVVKIGIADEMTDRNYLVVDGNDGRVYYAAMGKQIAHEAPEPGMIVALTSAGGKASTRTAQVKFLSHWPLERLPGAEALTWLDKSIAEDKIPALGERGFGAELSAVFRARADWLVANNYAVREKPGTITPKPAMVRDLAQEGWANLVRKLETDHNQIYLPAEDGMQFTGKHNLDVALPTARLALIQDRTTFTLGQSRPELAQLRGKQIDVSVRNRAITLVISRGRDRGLSR